MANPMMEVVSGNVVTEYLIQFNLIYRRLSNLKSDIRPTSNRQRDRLRGA